MMTELYEKLDQLLADGALDELESLVYEASDALASDAAAMHNSGDYHGAVENFRRIIELMRRYYDESDDFADIKLSISEIYSYLGDNDSAVKELSEAITIMTKKLGASHPSVKEAYAKLRLLLSK